MRGDVGSADFEPHQARIPVTLLRTNICSPLATNALAGNIWDNFSSQSYKQLPSVGTVTLSDPFSGEPMPYKMPAGGRGYTRVPSLISLWSTAPFLLNNTVGPFDTDPSVAARVKVFDASIEQMLWPQKRDRDSILGEKVPGTIDRTTQRSDVTIPVGFVPEAVQPLQSKLHRWLPWLVGEGGDIVLGPIPKDVPVGLLSNLKAPMMALSKCPDFVVNRGHYFGTAEFNKQDGLSADEKAFGSEPELSDDDKRALIAFLKTF